MFPRTATNFMMATTANDTDNNDNTTTGNDDSTKATSTTNIYINNENVNNTITTIIIMMVLMILEGSSRSISLDSLYLTHGSIERSFLLELIVYYVHTVSLSFYMQSHVALTQHDIVDAVYFTDDTWGPFY